MLHLRCEHKQIIILHHYLHNLIHVLKRINFSQIIKTTIRLKQTQWLITERKLMCKMTGNSERHKKVIVMEYYQEKIFHFLL